MVVIVTGLTRRSFFIGSVVALIAAPLARWGYVWRRQHPQDLSPIPWIGHC
jgi:hypothetical protein